MCRHSDVSDELFSFYGYPIFALNNMFIFFLFSFFPGGVLPETRVYRKNIPSYT